MAIRICSKEWLHSRIMRSMLPEEERKRVDIRIQYNIFLNILPTSPTIDCLRTQHAVIFQCSRNVVTCTGREIQALHFRYFSGFRWRPGMSQYEWFRLAYSWNGQKWIYGSPIITSDEERENTGKRSGKSYSSPITTSRKRTRDMPASRIINRSCKRYLLSTGMRQ